MTNNSKRFANRETVVKGFIINTATQEFNPFETTVSYVRSNDKAIQLVREQMNINEPEIIVTVNEIINEKVKPVRYNESKIFDYAIANFEDEEEAQHACTDNATVKQIHFYEYEAAFWAYDEKDDNYITDFVHDNSPLNMTKCDMRSFLAYSAHQLTGYEILGLHNCEKEETKLYCVIANDELEKCVIDK